MAPYLSLAVLLVLFSTCLAGKILVYPFEGSHWLNMEILLQALHARGHEITVLRTSTSWYVPEKSPYFHSITVIPPGSHGMENQDTMSSFVARSIQIQRHAGSLWGFVEFYRNLFGFVGDSQVAVANLIVSMLENRTLIGQLKESRFDVCLIDPAVPGGLLLAHYLDLPTVLNVRLHFRGEAHSLIAPSPWSYVPQLFSQFSDRMDFSQRLKNVIYNLALLYMYHFVSNPPYQAVCDRYFGGNVSAASLMQGADLWLIRLDFTLEFPRPTMPNVVYIGGFQTKPPRPLPADLEDFVQSSGEHGVAVVTFGTLLGDPGPETSRILASAFARIPQKVLWRHTGEQPAGLGNNTLLVDWLPQNDVLGHPKTKVFVTHGGTNGLYEAIYHGVPVLGIPLLFDQHDNMVRIKAHGVGEVVDVTALEVESFGDSLENILDPRKPYKRNMAALSRLHRDRAMGALDSAVFWVEYVARHRGAAHLRTESYKLPWYAYHSVDVVAFLALCSFVMVAGIWLSCRCLWRLLIKPKHSRLKSKSQ